MWSARIRTPKSACWFPPASAAPTAYSASARDLNLLGHADVIVANGLGAEQFLEKALAQKARATIITLSDDCDVIESQYSIPDHHDHDEHCDHATINAHVWVSPTQAIKQVKVLTRELARLYPDDASKYQANGQAYVERLKLLRDDCTRAAPSFERRNIATFHAAFDYLARDMNLNVVTTLTTAPGHTPTVAEMAEVIAAIRRNDVAAIITEPAYADSNRLAKTVSGETGVPVVQLNPFNTITGKPEPGSYETVMRENLAP